MTFSQFSTNLRQYAEDRAQRYALIVEQAEEIGGHPAIVPQAFVRTPWLWEHELQTRYYNMAEYMGWKPLPDFEPRAAAWLQS